MKLKRKYNNIIAALMLALYAFVTTPVSYWHHHKNNCDKNKTERHSQIVKKSTTAIDANCKICSHDYSVSNNDAITIYFSTLSFFTSYSIFFQINNITNPGYSQSNKGPPAIG